MIEFNVAWNGPDVHEGLALFRADAVRIVRASLRRITTTYLQDLQAYLPVRTGRLVRAVSLKMRFIGARGVVRARITVDTPGSRDDPRNAFYWRFVEFGHMTRPSRSGTGKPQWKVPGAGVITRMVPMIETSIANEFFGDLSRALDRQYTKANRV